jgi:hypothetical protein
MNLTNNTPDGLTALSKQIHELNHKWWHTPDGTRIERNRYELLMLVVSELVEAMEGERKDLMDDKLPHRKMAEVEMADAAIRILDYMGGFDLWFRRSYQIALSDNKAAALFEITCQVTDCQNQPDSIQRVCLSQAMRLIIKYCKMHGYDLNGAAAEKLEYNKTRADHSHEARAKEGGKKF